MIKKKEEHTTFEVGPISEPRMRALFEEYSRDIWRSGGAGREALRDELAYTRYIRNPVLESITGYPGGVNKPNVIQVEDIYMMYFNLIHAPEPAGVSSPHTIGLATSTNGLDWTFQSEVLSRGGAGAWDEGRVFVPSVIWDPVVAEFKMWFSGVDAGYTKYQIGLAHSPDGITWIKDPANPVLSPGAPGAWDEIHVLNPSVVMFEYNRYAMVYLGVNATQRHVGWAESANGVAWTKHADNPVLSSWSAAFEAFHLFFYKRLFVLTGDTIYMRGVGPDQDQVAYEIGVAFAYDPAAWGVSRLPLLGRTGPGRTWESEGVSSGVVHPSVLMDTDGSAKVYYAYERPGTSPTRGLWKGIGVAFFKHELLTVQGHPMLTYKPWRDKAVPNAGGTSPIVPTAMYERKTIYLLSNQDGSLDIEVDLDGRALPWYTFDTVQVVANTLLSYQTTHDMEHIRLNFDPVADATVSAWIYTSR